MRDFIASVKRFIREEHAPAMVEYALLLGVVSAVVMTAAALFGNGVLGLYPREGSPAMSAMGDPGPSIVSGRNFAESVPIRAAKHSGIRVVPEQEKVGSLPLLTSDG